jgi:hypothetical protein
MRTRPHPNWALLSALLVLAIGLLLEQHAVTRENRGLERAALLLIIYGLVVSWLKLWFAVRMWRDRTVCTIQSWRSSYIRKK